MRIREQGIDTGVGYIRHHRSSPFKFYTQPGINSLSSLARFGIAYRMDFIRFKKDGTDWSPAEQDAVKIRGLESKTFSFAKWLLDCTLQFRNYLGLRLSRKCLFATTKAIISRELETVPLAFRLMCTSC